MCDCEGNNYQINMGCCVPVVANPNIYYTKSEIDEKLSGITTEGISEEKAQELIDDSLEDYYTKDEIDAAFDSVNDELDGKLDASAYTPTDLSGYATEQWVQNQGYLTEHQHLKTINNISLIGDGNIEIGTGGTIDLSDYYTKSETNDLLDDKLDASAYTPTDLSDYWTSGETQEAINAATSGIPSSATIEGLRNDLNALSGDVYTNYYSKSQVDALIEALQSQIDALSECCSGSPSPSASGTKWSLTFSNGDIRSLDCYDTRDNMPRQIDDHDFSVHSQLCPFDETHTTSGVVSATIGDCVAGIYNGGMGGFTNLSSVTINPYTMYVYGNSAFNGDESLTTFPYAYGLETIGDYAFAHCYSLTHANIPSGVTSIGQWAFEDCTGLTSVTMEGTTPPTLGNWAFYNEYGTEQLNITIYVPAESVEAYKAASGWSTYADRIQAIP